MRSSRFNIFKEKNKLKKPPKEYLRLVWKIILAIFFTFMFLLTLTGCVQSFALSNGSGLSNGPEVIQKKEHQNPRFVKIDIFQKDENENPTKIDFKPNLNKTFLDWKNPEHKEELKSYHDDVEKNTNGEFENAIYGVNAVIKVGDNDKNPTILSWRPVDEKYKFNDDLIPSRNQEINKNKLKQPKDYLHLEFKFDFNDNRLWGHTEDWKLSFDDKDVLKENKKHILYTKYQLLKKIINEYKQNLDINDNDLTCDTTYDNNKKILVLNLFYNHKKLKMANDNDKHLGRSYGFAKLLVEIKKILSIDFSKNYIKHLKTLDPNSVENYIEENIAKDKQKDFRTIINNLTKNEIEVEANDFNQLLDTDIRSKITEDKIYKRLYWVKHYPMSNFNNAWKLGPFFSLVVYPLSKLYLLISNSFGQWSGWETILAITILVLIARIIQFIIGFKSKLQQAKTEALTYKKQAIEAKYAKYENNRQMKMRKQMEISKLHKKHGINMGMSMLMMLIQVPFFLALWRVINGIQQIKTASWLSIEFAETSRRRLFKAEFQYLPLLILAFGIQMLSVLIPKWLTKKQNKYKQVIVQPKEETTMMKVQKYMPFIFPIMSLMFSAGLQIYWIIGGVFSIIEAFIFHKINIKQKIKTKTVGFKQYDFL